MKFKKYAYPYLIWLFIFIIAPLFLVFCYSLKIGRVEYFTFVFYKKFFQLKYMKILFASAKIAFYATGICLLLGYPFAYIISKAKAKRRNVMILLVIIPMWMNFLLRTYAWIGILNRNGFLNNILRIFGLGRVNLLYTKYAVLIGMVYNFLPFMVLPIYSVLEKMDESLIEASKDLGATSFQTFLKVIFPLSIPGIVTGVIMVFIPAISTFEIASLLGGNKYNLIGNVIEQQFKFTGEWNFGSAMSIVLMMIILISIVITNKFGESEEKGGGTLW